MINLIEPIFITFIAGVVGTGIGGLVGALFYKNSNRLIGILLGFASGVMVSIVYFSLISEAIALTYDNEHVKLYTSIIGVLIGFFSMWVLGIFVDNKFYKYNNKNQAPYTKDVKNILRNSEDPHRSNLVFSGIIMTIAMAIHNLPEGMVIGASYYDQNNIVPANAISIAIVIGLHDIPEGMAISVPLISGGTKKAKAVLIAALSGLPTVIGAVLGYLLGGISEVSHTLSLTFAAGAMLFVVFSELIPESLYRINTKIFSIPIMAGIIIGMIIIFI